MTINSSIDAVNGAASSYPLPPPNASHESARLNVQHALSLADLDGELLLCPLLPPPNTNGISDGTSKERKKVADVGSGTGVWVIDFATRYPWADVVGLDLTTPPAESLPPNICFVVQDVEKPWLSLGQGSNTRVAEDDRFDLIHGRQILLNLRYPRKALKRNFENLKPGGMVEFREFWNPLVSETGTENVPLLVEWHQLTVDAAAAMGCDHGFASQLPRAMKEAGFVDVRVSDRRIPLGGWALDGDRRQDERTARMDALLTEMIRVGAQGMTKEMFVKALGWEVDQAAEYAERVVRELERKDLKEDRIYARFRIVCARKPL
ncbi:S-adenosyl-L-methionine-dependent methyltransferase [Rhypophila decipiens]|uniref:S-adenosyl-L-methionine-dependent methyltransferase n=1 Tax=Rhypophila decipiens TaxID=261697 RepID=A0AAN6XY43_9PEZI|nr:S-adenosyl-L-methionine-dependent methyltransferase [Rhypophila decipiens]